KHQRPHAGRNTVHRGGTNGPGRGVRRGRFRPDPAGGGSMTGAVAFIDTETTGLSEARRPWEIAVIRREANGATERWESFVRVSLEGAEPDALRVGRYNERFDPAEAVTPRQAAEAVAVLTAGAVLVGSNVQFDAHTLGRLLRAHGIMPTWHYRPLCVATLAAGYLAGL